MNKKSNFLMLVFSFAISNIIFTSPGTTVQNLSEDTQALPSTKIYASQIDLVAFLFYDFYHSRFGLQVSLLLSCEVKCFLKVNLFNLFQNFLKQETSYRENQKKFNAFSHNAFVIEKTRLIFL